MLHPQTSTPCALFRLLHRAAVWGIKVDGPLQCWLDCWSSKVATGVEGPAACLVPPVANGNIADPPLCVVCVSMAIGLVATLVVFAACWLRSLVMTETHHRDSKTCGWLPKVIGLVDVLCLLVSHYSRACWQCCSPRM